MENPLVYEVQSQMLFLPESQGALTEGKYFDVFRTEQGDILKISKATFSLEDATAWKRVILSDIWTLCQYLPPFAVTPTEVEILSTQDGYKVVLAQPFIEGVPFSVALSLISEGRYSPTPLIEFFEGALDIWRDLRKTPDIQSDLFWLLLKSEARIQLGHWIYPYNPINLIFQATKSGELIPRLVDMIFPRKFEDPLKGVLWGVPSVIRIQSLLKELRKY